MTDHWKEAVEAAVEERVRQTGVVAHNLTEEAILTAALPAIRRMLAEELRAADPYTLVEGCEQAAHAWGVAADFIEEGT